MKQIQFQEEVETQNKYFEKRKRVMSNYEIFKRKINFLNKTKVINYNMLIEFIVMH